MGPVARLSLGWISPVATQTMGEPSKRDAPWKRTTPCGGGPTLQTIRLLLLRMKSRRAPRPGRTPAFRLWVGEKRLGQGHEQSVEELAVAVLAHQADGPARAVVQEGHAPLGLEGFGHIEQARQRAGADGEAHQ